jgi:multidrug efflux pump subunit AcrB
MNITAAAINNNRVSIMVFLIIVIMGLLSYSKLSRDSMPPYTVRICTVVTKFPGASPERVEALITDKIEEKIQEIPELDNVRSESRTGLSVVTVELDDAVKEQELQPVWDKIRRDMESLLPELPEGIVGPEVKDDDIGVVYGIMLALEGDGYTFRELEDIADDIKDDLIKLPDASRVEIQGIQDEQIYVEYDDASLARLGISVSYIKNIISSTNIVFPGGDIVLENKRITLEPSGNYEDIEDLRNTLIPIGNGEQVQLGSIAKITREYIDPITRQVRVDGDPNLTISVALLEGGNLSNLGLAIDEKIEEYNTTFPLGLNVRRAASQDEYVNQKIEDFLMNVIQSIIIVLVVMLLFLGFRTGIVVSSLIPMVMIMTILLMSMFNVGLNQVSLAALIMALGLLVDNAIVMAESMMVKMEKGAKPKDAAIDSSKELMFPLLISSLTTSAAFLAFFLAESVMGEIMGPLFVVITLALLSSWIMGMTLVTMLGVAMIKVKQVDEKDEKPSVFDRINVYYKKVLLAALQRRLIFLVIIIGMFAGSLALFGQLPFIFFPDSDRNLVTLDLNLPLGTKIEATVETVAEIEEFIKDNLIGEAGVRDWTSFIAEGPESYDLGYSPGEANSGYAHLLINTNSEQDNQHVISALDEFCFNNLPDAEVTVALLAGGGSAGADVEIRVSGESPDELFEISERTKQKMASLPFAKNIKDDWGPKIKKFMINIDPDIAQRAGMTNQDIALSLQSSLSGYEIGSFREGDNTIPIVSRTIGSQSITVFELSSINIYSQQSGKSVPLAQVAEIVPTFDYAKILRRDLYRTMTISCDVKEGYTASNALNALLPFVEEDSENWPQGYKYELGGESESSADAMGAVADNLPLAGFIIIFLLVLQFNSFRKTSIVLLSIPLGIIGVILGLLVFNSYFGFMAFMGVISLAGIVINNAIVLIDRIDIELTEFKREPHEAVIAAAQQRFRPILLTTFTTSLGLIPLYLGGGLMWEPLAISIMIGLLFATVITLLFVPVLYSLFYKVKFS